MGRIQFFPLLSLHIQLKKLHVGDGHECKQTHHLGGGQQLMCQETVRQSARLLSRPVLGLLGIFGCLLGIGAELLLQHEYPPGQEEEKLAAPNIFKIKMRITLKKETFGGRGYNGRCSKGKFVDQQASNVLNGLDLTHVESLRRGINRKTCRKNNQEA